jgi:hypothetical protein
VSLAQDSGLPTGLQPVIFFGAAALFLTVLLVWFLSSAQKSANRRSNRVWGAVNAV